MVLTERRADILGLVVDEYVSTATPVSSRALVEGHDLGVSSATIRNELAWLEDEGYITHPHTSAGRVPSDVGYRLYVDRLMAEDPPAGDEQRTITHQFHQVTPGVEEWLRLAASVLAASVQNVAVVSRPRRRVTHLRHAQLVHLHPGAALLVVVLDDGRVRERIVSVDVAHEQPQLSRLAELLNGRYAGVDVRAAVAASDDGGGEELAALTRHVVELMDEDFADAELYVEGVRSTLRQPEFDSTDRILDAVQHLEAYHIQQVLHEGSRHEGSRVGSGETHVRIGRENPSDWMDEWSVVVSSYGERSGVAGTVAVFGPTRMRYGYTIPRVRFMASVMSLLLEDVQ